MEANTIIQILIFLVLAFQAFQLYRQHQLIKNEKQKSEKKLIIPDINKLILNTKNHYNVILRPKINILNPSTETNTVVKIQLKYKNKPRSYTLLNIDETKNDMNKLYEFMPIIILSQQAKVITINIEGQGLGLEYDLNKNLTESKEFIFKIYIEDVRGNPYEKDYIVELKA